MNEDFTKLAIEIKNNCLLKTEALFVENKCKWFSDFAKHFNEICVVLQKKQANHELSKVSFLEYTSLYTNFINKQYISEVIVYSDEHYCDENQQIIGAYDISFLFTYFNELWDKLFIVRKRFPGQVSSNDITSFMMESIFDFYSYFVNIVRFAVLDYADKGLIASVEKGEVFTMCVGYYMAKTEPVFVHAKNKNTDELIDWFLDEIDDVYMCGDYSGLDFSRKSFDYNNFCYANFEGASLKNTSLEGAMLIGSRFKNAQMEGCVMKNAIIYEADFSNANLRNANFDKAVATEGLPDESKWPHVGFLPVNFRCADLTGASFKGADLTGADFTDAVLTDVDFTDAILIKTIYDHH